MSAHVLFDLEPDHAICRRRADRRMHLRFGPDLFPSDYPAGLLSANCATCLWAEVLPERGESLADFTARALRELFPPQTDEATDHE